MPRLLLERIPAVRTDYPIQRRNTATSAVIRAGSSQRKLSIISGSPVMEALERAHGVLYHHIAAQRLDYPCGCITCQMHREENEDAHCVNAGNKPKELCLLPGHDMR